MSTINTTPASGEIILADDKVHAPAADPAAQRLFLVEIETRFIPIVDDDDIRVRPMITQRKTPLEQLDYGFDWTAWLTTPEVVFDSAWFISPNDGSLTIVTQSFNATETSVVLLDGTPGTVYTLTNRMFTDANPVRHAERSFQLMIVPVR